MGNNNEFRRGLHPSSTETKTERKSGSNYIIELGLLDESEIERIKKLCRDLSRDGDTIDYTRRDGTRVLEYAYDPKLLKGALYQVLKNRLLVINGYSYDDWRGHKVENEILIQEVDKILIRNMDESDFVYNFMNKIGYGIYTTMQKGVAQREEDIEKCLLAMNVPVIKYFDERSLQR